MKSIQRRLVVTLLTSISLLSLVVSLYLESAIRGKVETLLDETLVDKVQSLSTLADYSETEGFDFNFADEIMPEYDVGPNLEYFQLWLNQEDLYESSRSLKKGSLPRLGASIDTYKFKNIELPDGRAGRMIETSFFPRDDEHEDEYDGINKGNESSGRSRILNSKSVIVNNPPVVTLMLARERKSIDSLIFFIRTVIVFSILAVLSIMLFLIRSIVATGLKPLAELATQVEIINEKNLEYRIGGIGSTAKELLPIENEINRLLERLEESFSRIKRFSSDVAHELFTPISELRTLAEVGKNSSGDQETVLEFFEDVKEISVQMQQVVTGLLDLTQIDGGDVNIELSTFPIAKMLDDTWQAISHDSEGHLSFVNELPVDASITTDRDKLGILLRNVLQNASTYSASETDVRATFMTNLEKGILTITNVATDIEESDLSKIKDRLWRKDESRTDSGHAGLGLALANSIANFLGLELSFKLEDGNVFCASISGLKTEKSNHSNTDSHSR